MLAAWNSLAQRIDRQAYDWITEPQAGEARDAVVVAIDEAALRARGEMRNVRKIVAEALEKIAAARAKAVVVDVILASEVDSGDDARLEAALRAAPNLILPIQIDTSGKWEKPAARFLCRGSFLASSFSTAYRHSSDLTSSPLEMRMRGMEGRPSNVNKALQDVRNPGMCHLVQQHL